ncbi:YbaK/EbsC family protein [Allosaccharopolyspora coralli]|uniref:YbaK/EbsC family protein n=1 Tax=Allosaccharopolyspora coralli TaxID=2665642 RepID=A0A5Q3QA34_9PSEU|nr:YbaK/EbsC family protein [Allosaccharopolyspora coralli]QGK68325.1 YbaK/EbsC family protein [Allosaccharopolyspora coralli]
MDQVAQDVAERLRGWGATGEIVEFEDTVPTAAVAAQRLGCEVGAIANSLVFRVGDEPLLIITSGAHRADTQRVAARLEIGPIKRADPEFVLACTGQPVGGVAPVGHPQPIRTVVDSALTGYPTVWAGGGTKHTMFPTSHDELVRLTGGLSTEVAQEASG